MEWHGFAIHIDDEMWPDKKFTLPPWPSTIDVEMSGETVQFLAPRKALS
jgi:hypothetical protein